MAPSANQPVERMSAGTALSPYRWPGAAATAHLCRWRPIVRTIALLPLCACLGVAFGLPGATAPHATSSTNGVQLAPLVLTLPPPSWGGNGIYEHPSGPYIEPLRDRPRAAFLAPVGVTNLALRKKVTASVANPVRGELARITDGEKADGDPDEFQRNVVELPAGLQWVQIDLGLECKLYAIVIWHDYYFHHPIFRNVIVQAAEDASFTKQVRTLFNNDRKNLAGLGEGTDKQYTETNEGKLIDAKGTKARYLRFYSDGNHNNPLNGYVEIEAWGFPAADGPRQQTD